MRFIGYGLCEDVLTYPPHVALYTVSVRQYRSLQSRFLQCMPRDKPHCDLLTGFTNSPVRDFHSLEYFGIFDTNAHAGRTQRA